MMLRCREGYKDVREVDERDDEDEEDEEEEDGWISERDVWCITGERSVCDESSSSSSSSSFFNCGMFSSFSSSPTETI